MRSFDPANGCNLGEASRGSLCHLRGAPGVRSPAALNRLGCRVECRGDRLCRVLAERALPEAQAQRQFQVFHAAQNWRQHGIRSNRTG